MTVIRFGEKGLLPAVVQDYETHELLMVAYMNKESLTRTLETKEAWFYSRSRQNYGTKGRHQETFSWSNP